MNDHYEKEERLLQLEKYSCWSHLQATSLLYWWSRPTAGKLFTRHLQILRNLRIISMNWRWRNSQNWSRVKFLKFKSCSDETLALVSRTELQVTHSSKRQQFCIATGEIICLHSWKTEQIADCKTVLQCSWHKCKLLTFKLTTDLNEEIKHIKSSCEFRAWIKGY